MNTQSLLYGIGGLVIGAVLMFVFNSGFARNSMMQSTTPAAYESAQSDSGMDMSMQDMMDSLKGKTGEEFDKVFISSMIQHHTGAIEMAREAQMSAGRDEIKNLANDIITAQEKEIGMMREWQKDWGFTE